MFRLSPVCCCEAAALNTDLLCSIMKIVVDFQASDLYQIYCDSTDFFVICSVFVQSHPLFFSFFMFLRSLWANQGATICKCCGKNVLFFINSHRGGVYSKQSTHCDVQTCVFAFLPLLWSFRKDKNTIFWGEKNWMRPWRSFYREKVWLVPEQLTLHWNRHYIIKINLYGALKNCPRISTKLNVFEYDFIFHLSWFVFFCPFACWILQDTGLGRIPILFNLIIWLPHHSSSKNMTIKKSKIWIQVRMQEGACR